MTAYIYRLTSIDRPWSYAVEWDFSPEMVDAVKRMLPSRYRLWKPEYKQWWFRADVIEEVCQLANIFCGGYVHVGKEAEPAHRGPVEEAYAALHLLPSAPPDVVRAAYRALCKLYHPDTGGTTREMQRINEAYGHLARHRS